jgi:hypothetical protein
VIDELLAGANDSLIGFDSDQCAHYSPKISFTVARARSVSICSRQNRPPVANECNDPFWEKMMLSATGAEIADRDFAHWTAVAFYGSS